MGTGFKLIRLALAALVFGLGSAEAQQPNTIRRAGILSSRFGPFPALDAFKDRLREHGWIEGKQIEVKYRYAGNQVDKLFEFATEFVRLKCDIMVAGPDNAATIAAKRATTTIPIVMVGVVDRVSNGLVESLARPGANVTGVTYEVTREQAGKNLELLKQSVPTVSRVAILRNPNASSQILYSKEADRAAKNLGVTIKFADVQAPTDKGLEDALGGVALERADGLLVTPDPFFADHRQQIINFAAQRKLPAVYFGSGFVNNGGLMSYGPYSEAMWRRAATYVDRILNGAKPADLPVEQPSKLASDQFESRQANRPNHSAARAGAGR